MYMLYISYSMYPALLIYAIQSSGVILDNPASIQVLLCPVLNPVVAHWPAADLSLEKLSSIGLSLDYKGGGSELGHLTAEKFPQQ